MKRLFTLIALACLVGSVNLLAQVQLGTIDFTGLQDHTDYNEYSAFGILSEVEGRPLYISKGTRQITITFDEIDQWQIYHTTTNNNENISYLECKKNDYASLYINGLKEGDKVKITPKGNICLGNAISDFGTYTDFSVEKELTINTDGNLEVKTRSANNGIYKIEVTGEEEGGYHYDPSVEGYDLYWVGRNAAYTYEGEEMIGAGFNLDTSNQEAILLAQLGDGTPISKRIAISKNSNGSTPWSLSHVNSGDASQGLKNMDSNWHNISICNLKKGDRVRITFHNDDYREESWGEKNVGHAKFGSVGTSSYNGCAAFQDTNNNGTQDEGEPSVEAELNLAGVDNTYKDYVTYFYTITEDGHLDIAFDGNVRLCQVEIYNDHLAVMVDKDNGSHETGYTAYFNNTGQLETKTHVIPGGLKVQMGNTVETQHGGVVASPDIPMAFVYDEQHHKIPRNDNSTGLFTPNNDFTDNLPTKGTFHKFTPEVDGKMTVRFFTANVNYLWPEKDGNYSDLNNTSNENPVHVECPYYLIKVNPDGTTKEIIETIRSFGSKEIERTLDVQAGYSYYLFGGWSNDANANNYSDRQDVVYNNGLKKSIYGCGIANLLDVTFIVDKVVRPLAKWIENAKKEDDNLAYVKGYKYVKVKKMSGNIESCHPYLDGTTLKIDQIVYKDGDVNKGGVILIEITDDLTKYDRTDPVFALTVAYDAAYHSDNQHAEAERGHTWDFSTNPLNGLQWKNDTYSTYAVVTPFGTSTEENSLLNQEMNWTDVHGTKHSDWTFGYRSQQSGNSYDPQFINHYDLSGDNADMMWDTEGVVMFASANLSSIFNEKIGAIDRTDKTQADPDRYVGLWPHSGEGLKSEFIIPHLDKDDRVIIWMGSGEGTGHEQMVFNITNARDAEYKEINPNDEYIAGGSKWNSANSDPYYRGCYHFFAKEKGDMKFTLVGGYMCKIYKVQIYTGDRIYTNEIAGKTDADNKYLLWSRANDPNDNTGQKIGGTYNWTLKYFNKDQKLADGSNSVKNDIISKTGQLTKDITTNTANNTFTYPHALGEIGTFRMRGKDMEKNMKYVADYADRNVTVAYQETMTYPYTWDFKDMIGQNESDFRAEDALEAAMPVGFTEEYWNSIKDTYYEITSNDLSLWETTTQTGTYYLRLNSQQDQDMDNPKERDNIFETAQIEEGNQVWANGKVVPETRGLWFYTSNNFNHSEWYISSAGMEFRSKAHKLVVPNVPAGAAVYLRMTKTQPDDANSFTWQWNSDCEVYGNAPQKVDGTSNDYIFAIKNNGAKRNLVLSLKGYRLLKLAVSTDPKAIGKTGYATESRARDIDHYLTSYLTGKPIKAYTATISDGYEKVVLSPVGATDNGVKILPAATNGDTNGCILYHDGGTANSDGTTNRTVSILDGGFHVFVPDMHDKDNTSLKANTTGNVMKSFNPVNDLYNVSAMTTGYLLPTDGSNNTNLILTAKKYKVGTDGSTVANDGYDVFFVRVDPNGNSGSGAKLKNCSAYIQIPTKDMVELSTPNNDGSAKMSIVFADDWFGEINNGIATGIDQVTSNKSQVTSAEWYNLNGQKLNGMPTEKGLYIVNGRKVLVK